MLRNSGMVVVFVCLLGVIAFALIGIYPNHATMVELDHKITPLNQRIETQRVIVPIYKELLKKAKQQDLHGLDYPPELTPAKPEDIEKFSIMLSNLARENQMELKIIAPDSDAYLKNTKYLGMNVSLTGDFFHFRRFLIQICYIPFLQDIESIRINIKNQKHTYELRLILAQE